MVRDICCAARNVGGPLGESSAGQGVPFYFSNYVTVRDGKVVTRGMPVGGVRRGRFVGEIVASAALWVSNRQFWR